MGSVTDAPTDAACGFCGGGERVTLARVDAFRFVRCPGCGLAYLTPRPSAQALRGLYAGYHARAGASEASWARLMHGVFRESAEWLCRESAGTAGRLLDIGCGFGSFLALMTERGWVAEGCDVSAPVVEAAVRRGRRVRLAALEELEAAPGSYDAITMFYVLEHLPDPCAALRRAADLLAPGGILLVRVPHTTPLVRLLAPLGLGATLYDVPFHLYDFSPAVLGAMLRRTGFSRIRTFPGRPTVPSRPAARAVAWTSGAVARALYRATGGRFLLPGVSKTTIARRPSR